MIPLAELQFIWFTIFVILLTGYTILDGFDLGVGMLHLFSSKDEERRLMLNTIGPVWDGNEVWLVTAGGALLAGFPDVYATVCSAFYIPIMVLLAGLIFRAVAIEVRSKQPMAWWRWTWDALFSLASLIIAFGLGIALGNLIIGLPIDENKEFTGDMLMLLVHPYAVASGIFVVSLFFMHGCIFVLMKTEGELHDKMRAWINPSIIFFTICYAMLTMATLIFMPHMTKALQERPIFFIVAILNVLAIANIPREIQAGRDARAFMSSCGNIICLMLLYAIGSYPNVVRAVNDPNLSLTIFNSSSSEKTLGILLLIAIIGIPLVVSYTIAVYWIFRGKVKLDATSY